MLQSMGHKESDMTERLNNDNKICQVRVINVDDMVITNTQCPTMDFILFNIILDNVIKPEKELEKKRQNEYCSSVR